ncbi:MAG TPA: hypothetical protein VFB46_10540 [Gemmatimonadaceae bacterium]|nr:hypothetical protein [Gemmatimonadaceae bacterium]
MRPGILSLDDVLSRATRVPAIADRGTGNVRTAELVILALIGAGAALLTNLARFRLGIPGSNILFVAFPMALGLSLVPRRGAGTVMAGGALVTTGALWLMGVRLDGVGAQTSLLLTGPFMDLAVRWARHGWRLYAALILACATTNALAFAARAMAKIYGLPGGGGGGGRQFSAWLPQAVWTYAVAGIIAGLLSAAAWFHFRERDGSEGARADVG